jgi:hypothetical protein
LAHVQRFFAQPRLVTGWLIPVIRSCGWWFYFVYIGIFALENGLGETVGGVASSLANMGLFLAPLMLRWMRQNSVRKAVRVGCLGGGIFFLAGTLLSPWPWTTVAILMTVGVYGAVAAIVRLDDLGLMLGRRTGHRTIDAFLRRLGAAILSLAPWLMKSLSVIGTIAMFLVGGGILVHGIPALHHAVQAAVQVLGQGAADGALIRLILEQVLAAAIGLAAGAITLASWTLIGWVIRTDR